MSRLWTDDGRTTECEDRARILETEFAIISVTVMMPTVVVGGYGTSGVRREHVSATL